MADYALVAQSVEHIVGNDEVSGPIPLGSFSFYKENEMASKKKSAVEIIALQCTECKRKNYTTYKNRKNITGKLEKNKYCPFCRKEILHKETKAK